PRARSASPRRHADGPAGHAADFHEQHRGGMLRTHRGNGGKIDRIGSPGGTASRRQISQRSSAASQFQSKDGRDCEPKTAMRAIHAGMGYRLTALEAVPVGHFFQMTKSAP